ncbi:DNA gyrase inhibitor [Bacillus pseudomycoides]|uniref:AraC family transcriptional regulator n=1 Tax=Bacillus pseudomycoides TaxID=64104 RepID=UPI000BEE4509|nr:GyrI-like domain-containing protein [Bacillus pseudomycoides]PDY44424.1 DNA gyrase inhibitor [Bacillus pseudomycoides]PFZ02391.1 DNA gyrase inhibitor [Bacillus pseudomycoides]PGC30909.1 DNA gyrase inhibitor [Bacillus pseudomycoides]PHB37640.1 DNA gyrase inhibitor [Bacillus pseudomycoides]
MKFKVETLPNYRIAYVRRVGPYGSANIEVMEKLKKWANEKDLLKSATLLAIPQDNPETTLPENCRFDACIVISKDYQLDDSICESELSGGKYLIYEIKHTAEDIQKAYADIFPSLQSNGYQIDNKPILERYAGDMINNPYCEICVPIKPL